MILLWGLPGDEPLAAVLDVLREQHANVALLDQHEVLTTEVELLFETEIVGTVSVGGTPIDLSQVGAVYMRPYDSRRLPSVSQALSREGNANVPSTTYALAIEGAMTAWCGIAHALVIN